MTKAPLSLFLLALAALIFLSEATPVSAGACAPDTVAARSEELSFVWIAKTKARANWRRKVRAMPGLGPDYSNWSRAKNTEERCLSGPAGAVCIFTGTPCLP